VVVAAFVITKLIHNKNHFFIIFLIFQKYVTLIRPVLKACFIGGDILKACAPPVMLSIKRGWLNFHPSPFLLYKYCNRSRGFVSFSTLMYFKGFGLK
jgi:hypothetical protein